MNNRTVIFFCGVFLLFGILQDHGHAFSSGNKHKLHHVDGDWKVTGTYVNEDYGYYVKLPKHYTAHIIHPADTNHGFEINLNNKQLNQFDQDHLTAYHYYQVADDDNTLEDIEKSDRSLFIMQREVIVKRTHTILTLSGLSAWRIITKYKLKSEYFIEDKIVAIRKNGGGIIYTLSLNTLASNYIKEVHLLNEMISNFHTTPIDNGNPM